MALGLKKPQQLSKPIAPPIEQPTEQPILNAPVMNAIGKEQIDKAIETLKKYKEGKANLDQRIVDNEQWYKGRHWALIRDKYGKSKPGLPEPSSAWLFNSLANKHADAMDNYPEPCVLPREQSDEKDASSLSMIVPVILDRNDFENTYSNAWWSKLKSGPSCYGVFWDGTLENGLGDIQVKEIDFLKVYYEPGITDIQKSRNLFIVDIVDNDILEGQYEQLKGKLSGDTIDVAKYVEDDTVDTKDKSVVVDWYYKTRVGTKTLLHYVKFCNSELLYASENVAEYKDKGYYNHGEYPIAIDNLFPEAGTPVSFGYVDICKDPQIYIDKLNQAIICNALLASKKRFIVSESAGVNKDELLDYSKDVVSCSGRIDDTGFKELETKSLDSSVMQMLEFKVNELKETSGNRDVNQGSSGGGVTAASAISALQEAGNKLSRDMIKGSYTAYTQVVTLVIELIRQFYSIERCFRIEGKSGEAEYIQYSNAGIAPNMTIDQVTGMENTRKPIFDIKVSAQRKNPFSRAAQNELAKTLFGSGLFNPQLADQALITLDMMDFEGKEKIIEKVQQNGGMAKELQQLQMQMQQLMGVQPQAQATAQPKQAESSANSLSYQDKLAERSVPKIE